MSASPEDYAVRFSVFEEVVLDYQPKGTRARKTVKTWDIVRVDAPTVAQIIEAIEEHAKEIAE